MRDATSGYLIGAGVAVSAGVVIGGRHPALALAFSAAALFFVAVGGVWHSTLSGLVALVLAASMFGAADAAWRESAIKAAILPRAAKAESVVRVCGLVVGRRPKSIDVSASRVRTDSRSWRVREPVRIRGPEALAVAPGRTVCASGRMLKPIPNFDGPPMLNPVYVTSGRIRAPVRFAAGVVRRKFSVAAQKVLPDRQAGLLLGMTEGDVALLDDETIEAFRTTGLAHLVAVSGSNVAVVLAVTMLGVRLVVRRSRWLRVLAAAPPLVFFAFLTAMEASVLRAVVTAGIVLAVTASGRTADALRGAAVSFVVLVLADPALISSIGFQLSFAATVGLVVWSRPLTELIVRALPWSSGPAVELGAMAVATTVAAQLAVAPLLAVHFGKLPAIGAVANLVVAPLAGVVMVGGVVTLGAASLFAALDWAPAMMRLPLDVILTVASFFSRLPHASVDVSIASAIMLACAGGIALASGRRARSVLAAIIVVTATVAIGARISAHAATCPGAEIIALDVGGTALLMRAGGRSVLYDGGPADGRVVAALKSAGVDSLDAVITSHPHADHTEGLVEVARKLRVAELVGPFTMGWGRGTDLVKAADQSEVPRRVVFAGDVLRVGREMRFDVLGPEDSGDPPERSDEAIGLNNLMIRATVGGMSVLLPGDAVASAQDQFTGAEVASTVLLAVHHGSADLSPAFVDAVNPSVTLIGVGAANRYGHPTAIARAMYAAHGRVYRTDTQGRIVVCARDTGLEVTTTR